MRPRYRETTSGKEIVLKTDGNCWMKREDEIDLVVIGSDLDRPAFLALLR